MSAKKLMAGKRGLIMGVANQHSIAWGIAKAAHDHGAELAFTFQGEAFEKRVRPIAESVNAAACLPCNVATDESIKETFEALGKVWDSFDFVVHAIAYSDKEELKGRYVDTTRNNFRHTLDISCFSFTSVAKYAEPMLRPGGSLLTLTYEGAQRVMPSYNVMGVAKAALEASVKYLAVDLGRNGVRVNALSAGPMRTLAGSAIAGARFTYNWQGKSSPLRRNIELEEVGNSGLYLISDLSGGVTGEVHYVDSGYHLVGMAIPAETDLE
ncbi:MULTISPECIES: enoyl-ACP reductase FabI [unclassified Hwanghaeella]|jgi:enoyl-[acyl-carrier protein] reductase I|uniref:enoyl-ACP reductase FabI n=1 Tax=unclassified Hwanghaeella TaxID=2605944 RepID=UPI0026D6ABC0|tara:strand:+ start:12949 stop:13752 length:804 start_codon:yes stop_codon:yes gene_type:complete